MAYYSIIPILLSLITGLVFSKSAKPFFLLPLVALLALTAATEFSVNYFLVERIRRHYVNVIYNLFSLVDMGVWLLLFYRFLVSEKLKLIVVVIGVLLIIYSIVDIQFVNKWRFLHADSERIYCLFMLFLSIAYLNQRLSLPYENLFKNPHAYLCAACIVYHGSLFGNLTILGEEKNAGVFNIHYIFLLLQLIANCIYYILLCAAFAVCYWTQRDKARSSIQESSSSTAY